MSSLPRCLWREWVPVVAGSVVFASFGIAYFCLYLIWVTS